MFQFLFCYILERKDKKWFKRDIIVLISFLTLFVLISFLVNIGKEMSLSGFRRKMISFLNEIFVVLISVLIFYFNFYSAHYRKGNMISCLNEIFVVLILVLIFLF